MGNKVGEPLAFEDRILAVTIAHQRWSQAISKGCTDLKVSYKPSEVVNLNGMGAEIFVARKYGVTPDIATNEYPDADLIINGKTVDVKYVAGDQYGLLVYPNKKDKACDAYFVVHGQFPCYRLTGWATKEDVFVDSNYTTISGKGAYMIEKHRLRKFKDGSKEING